MCFVDIEIGHKITPPEAKLCGGGDGGATHIRPLRKDYDALMRCPSSFSSDSIYSPAKLSAKSERHRELVMAELVPSSPASSSGLDKMIKYKTRGAEELGEFSKMARCVEVEKLEIGFAIASLMQFAWLGDHQFVLDAWVMENVLVWKLTTILLLQ